MERLSVPRRHRHGSASRSRLDPRNPAEVLLILPLQRVESRAATKLKHLSFRKDNARLGDGRSIPFSRDIPVERLPADSKLDGKFGLRFTDVHTAAKVLSLYRR